MSRFQHSADVAAGEWIGPRLRDDWPSPEALAPSGFEAYVRIFHPADGIPWHLVCAATGARWHSLMQWPSVSAGWSGGEPHQGSLGLDGLAQLADLIGGDPAITVALWIGYGSINGQAVSAPSSSAESHQPDRQSGWVTDFDIDVIAAPQLQLPGRDYALFRGQLTTLGDPLWPERSGWAWRWDETINLAWPDDHSWFLLSEIDLDSTILGCSATVAERILSSALEAAAIPWNADLGHNDDLLNR